MTKTLALTVALVATLAPRAWCETSQAETPERLTLEAAVDHALAANRTLQIAVLEAERAAAEVAAIRTHRGPAFGARMFEGGFLAPLDFDFRRGAFGTFAATGPIPFADTTVTSPRRLITAAMLTVNQPLTQLKRIGVGIRLSELNRDLSQARLSAERASIVGRVKRLYYGILQALDGQHAVNDAIALFKELDRVVDVLVQQQVKLRSDSLAVKTQLARAEYDRLVLINMEATLREQLNVLMGRDVNAALSPAPVPEATLFEVDIDTAEAEAVGVRPALREAAINVERARQQVRLKDAERIPEITATFSFARLFGVEVLPHNVAAAGIFVSWQPFDWGRRRLEEQAAQKALQQATIGLQEAEGRVRSDVRARHRKVLEARELLRVARLAQDAARERLRVSLDRYRAEAALLNDALQAQAGLSEATQQVQQALLGFWAARVDLDEAVGASVGRRP